MATTLLNLTHHPSTKWPPEQTDAAVALADDLTIEDMPFPNVAPSATTSQVDALADELTAEILSRYTAASLIVHLMGEMTLVVALVARLQGEGTRVLASTTERIATDGPDGERRLVFRFHSFRDYTPLYVESPGAA